MTLCILHFTHCILHLTLCILRITLFTQVRDEFRMTLHCYMTLYETSTINGFKNSVAQEEARDRLRAETEALEAAIARLAVAKVELGVRHKVLERREKEDAAVLATKYVEEANILKRNNFQLKTQIEAILSVKKEA